jgi:receptor-binding and translocation channel-forming TcA subunit of Tc toxin
LSADEAAPLAPAATVAAADQVLLVNLAPVNTALITVKNQPGWFVFDNGDDVFLGSWQTDLRTIEEAVIASTALSGVPAGLTTVYTEPYTPPPVPPPSNQKYAFTRLGTHTIAQLSQTLFTGGIDALLSIPSQEAKELPFSRFYPNPPNPPSQVINTTTDRLDFNGAYGPYFWDLFFHAVFLIADSLKLNRRHAEAKAWYQYIFDPTAKPEAGNLGSNDRYWRFLPFRGLTWESLAQILTNVGQIAAYNDDPFDPHAIARLRLSAYPKSIVMHYIDNLLEWADALYSLDTRESITQATNLYVLASDLLGPRPVDMGSFEHSAALSYDEIQEAYAASGTAQAASATSITLAATASAKNYFYNGLTLTLTGGKGAGQVRTVLNYDGASKVATVAPWSTTPDSTTTYQMSGIPQFLIELEGTHIVAEAATAAGGFAEAPFNDIDAYFCIPENQEFIAYWDRIEDRIYKIRHCMDIHGVIRQLALFEPPLDVRALVRAAASGNFSAAVTSPTAQPVPSYRFAVMLEKTKELTATLTGLGGGLLGALQQTDAEAVALLRLTQERAILNLTTKIRTDQITMVADQRQALVESRAAAVARAEYYKKLVAQDLSPGELANLTALEVALRFNILASVVKTASSIGYAVPQVGSPFAMTYGGQQLGAVLDAISGVAEIGSTVAAFGAERSLTMSNYERRAIEWQFQADLADADLKQIDAEILAVDVQSQIARQELVIHEKTIAQNDEMEAFLKRKFTNKELYQWMSGRIATFYFQTYSLAYDMALGAQRAYQFENNSNDTFINFGYWDNLHKGLMASEGLMLGLNQMESAYLAKSGRNLEIERTVSLLQTNPRALLDLRRSGECSFELTERMFDQDYPGHYARKIKTISISLPAIVGPYQNIKATLTQTSNRVALTSDVKTVRYLLGIDQGDLPGPDKMRSDWLVNQQIALSSGVDDNGLFVLDFQDPRYLPFEGTGAVSTWHLSMPKAANRIDYDAISDVVIELRYTASSGGKDLRDKVVALAPVKNYAAGAFYSLAQQWSDRWFAFMQDHNDPDSQTLAIPLIAPIAPPQVAVNAVVSVSLFLQVRDGASAAGDYVSITFPGDKQSTPISISAANTGNVIKRVSKYSGDWKLTFKLGVGGAPTTITNGPYLDPTKLLTVAMIVYYDGTLDWS